MILSVSQGHKNSSFSALLPIFDIFLGFIIFLNYVTILMGMIWHLITVFK